MTYTSFSSPEVVSSVLSALGAVATGLNYITFGGKDEKNQKCDVSSNTNFLMTYTSFSFSEVVSSVLSALGAVATGLNYITFGSENARIFGVWTCTVRTQIVNKYTQ